MLKHLVAAAGLALLVATSARGAEALGYDPEADAFAVLGEAKIVAAAEFFGRLPEAAGAPHFWVLSSTGDVLASPNTLPLENGAKSYDRRAFRAFIDRWRAHAVR